MVLMRRPMNPRISADSDEHVFAGIGDADLKLLLSSSPDTGAGLNLNLVDLCLSQLTLEAAIDIGYGGLFKSSTSASVGFFLIELLASQTIIPDPAASQGVVGVEWGVGARIGVAVQSVSSSLSSDFVTLAAKGGAANISVDVIGVPDHAASDFVATVGSGSIALNVDSLQSIGAASGKLMSAIIDLAATSPTELTPKPLYLQQVIGDDDLTKIEATSNGYALHRLGGKGESYASAIAHLSSKLNDNSRPYASVDPMVVAANYISIMGAADITNPSKDQRATASTIERTGH